MKYCCKCGKTYDDTWKVCLNCTNPLQDHTEMNIVKNSTKGSASAGMKWCSHCGEEIREKAVLCPKCGNAASCKGVNALDPSNSGNNAPDWAYCLTCCCAPIPGVILYLIWKDDRPKAAKDIFPWMMAGCIIFIVIFVLALAFGALAGLIGGLL